MNSACWRAAEQDAAQKEGEKTVDNFCALVVELSPGLVGESVLAGSLTHRAPAPRIARHARFFEFVREAAPRGDDGAGI